MSVVGTADFKAIGSKDRETFLEHARRADHSLAAALGVRCQYRLRIDRVLCAR